MEGRSLLAGRYELREPIGEGASSVVWDALDRETSEAVAVKVVSLDEAGWRAEVRDRFQQEARLLSLVRHPHLVEVRDLGETDDGSLYLVLERLHGETLAERLGRAPRLSWREAGTLALELARGLAALHGKGVIHRDLKPGNVILHQSFAEGAAVGSVAKIIDLGISKVRAAASSPQLSATLTATGQILGTPEYMSYEQALGERDLDERADVWALGVVLFEMLVGRRPFEGANVNAVLAQIRKGPPDSLRLRAAGAPASLTAVVERCLRRERGERPANGDELARAIAAALADAEREVAQRRLRTRAVVAVGIAAVILAALVLALR